MSGAPIRRARKEAAAREAMRVQAGQRSVQDLPKVTEYTPELADEICDRLAAGESIADFHAGDGGMLELGICSQIGVSQRTLARWQREHPELRQAMHEARHENTHRMADIIGAMGRLALRDPAMANAVRVAGDHYKWRCAVLNPDQFGERKRVDLHGGPDLADKLRRARERIIDAQPVAIEGNDA